MISRKVHRPSSATEHLQQLCLNSSKGISETAPHNDTSHVHLSKNFVVNQDGSLSLRKPVILANMFSTNISKVVPLHNAYLVIGTFDNTDGLLLLDSKLQPIKYRVVWTGLDGNRRTRLVVDSDEKPIPIPKSTLDLTQCKYVHTSGTVLLNTCFLNINTEDFPGKKYDEHEQKCKVYDTSLYDSEVTTSPVFVRVYFQTDWCVEVHVPPQNEYSTVDFMTNVLLSNPYSVRDVYNASAPRVVSIVPYVYTARQPEGVVPSFTNSEMPVTHTYTLDLLGHVSCDRELDRESSTEDGKQHYTFVTTPDYDYGGSFILFDKYGIQVLVTYSVIASYSVYSSEWEWDTGDNSFVPRTLDVDVSVYLKTTNANDNLWKRNNFKIKVPKHIVDLSVTNNVCWNADNFLPPPDTDTLVVDIGHDTFSVPIEEQIVTIDDFEQLSDAPDRYCLLARKQWTLYEDSLTNNIHEHVKNGWGLKGLANSARTTRAYLTVGCAAISNDGAVDLKLSCDIPTIVNAPVNDTVRQLTESAKNMRFRSVNYVAPLKHSTLVLKAFISVPYDTSELYATWAYTLDGISWLEMYNADAVGAVSVSEPSAEPLPDVSVSEEERPTVTHVYLPLYRGSGQMSVQNLISERSDCLVLSDNTVLGDNVSEALAFKFKLCKLYKFIDKEDGVEASVEATYGEQIVYTRNGTGVEFVDFDLQSPVASNFKYMHSKVFMFGSGLKNSVFYTFPGELYAPVTNRIDVSAMLDDSVTTVVPWRSYLIIGTPTALHISESVEDGFLTKVLNPSLGIPDVDKLCCVPILNGVIFKSGSKIYQLYPNVYADDGTVLNVTDISQNISSILDGLDGSVAPFAFSTTSEYVLMLPKYDSTSCLRYSYDTRLWTYHDYPVVFTSAHVRAVDEIALYSTPAVGQVCEYLFDADVSKLPFESVHAGHLDALPYGDIVRRGSGSGGVYGSTIKDTVTDITNWMHSGTGFNCVTPISFELDSGQKTDTILTTKQFVESKMVFATEHGDDAFPMQLVVHVDGDPHTVTRDISTDAAFWKDSSTSGVLNTTFGGLSSTSDSFNTLRQLVVRYSGKGKSVRHILTGESLCNFKLYETYIRYKLLNVKQ